MNNTREILLQFNTMQNKEKGKLMHRLTPAEAQSCPYNSRALRRKAKKMMKRLKEDE